MSLLDINALTVRFARPRFARRSAQESRALDGVTLTIDAGDSIGIVGESGSGKTTLARTLLQLQRPSGGTVEYRGKDLAHLTRLERKRSRREIQLVFQDPFSSLNPRMKVGQAIGDPIRIHRLRRSAEVELRVAELLEMVGLDAAAASRYPHEFSGGQRQRIGIARALAVQPHVLVCDEPVSALDVSIQAQIINLLLDLRESLGLTLVFVAHDLAVVKQISTRIAVMYLGRVVELGSRDQIYDAPQHPYTAALLSAVPIPDPALERVRERIVLRGDAQSIVVPSQGCRFRSRCWRYSELNEPELCATADPVLGSGALPVPHAACHFPPRVASATSSGAINPMETEK